MSLYKFQSIRFLLFNFILKQPLSTIYNEGKLFPYPFKLAERTLLKVSGVI